MATVWPDDEKTGSAQLTLPPFVDIRGILSGNPTIVSNVTSLVDEACRKHGMFMVVNHGIDPDLIREAHKEIDRFFGISMSDKLRTKIEEDTGFGYACNLTGQLASIGLRRLETLTFPFYTNENQSTTMDVEKYFLTMLGEEYRHFGIVMQKYCEAMNELSLDIMELLSVSLGINRNYFREFFKENDSKMRLNYYPPYEDPISTFGIAPHCDPSSITILHQEDIAGLQVLMGDEKWVTIPPNRDAFVINIGDTFMALSNGIYKSCVHSAILNSKNPRQSITYFVNPNKDKIVIPPSDLVNMENPRLYPNFTWSQFLDFGKTKYVIDTKTMDAFSQWIVENSVTSGPTMHKQD